MGKKYIILHERWRRLTSSYRAFHGFGQSKFAHGGSILGFRNFGKNSMKTILFNKNTHTLLFLEERGPRV